MLIDLEYRPFEFPALSGVTCRVRPLEVWAYQSIMNAVSPHQHTEADGRPTVDMLALAMTPDTVEIVSRIIQAHVTDLRGLEIRADGETRAAVLADIVKYGTLWPSALALMAHLISVSVLTDDAMGNSSAPRVNT